MRQTVPTGLTRDDARLSGSDEFLRSRLREWWRGVEKVGKRRVILSKRLLMLKGIETSVSSVRLREMVLGR